MRRIASVVSILLAVCAAAVCSTPTVRAGPRYCKRSHSCRCGCEGSPAASNRCGWTGTQAGSGPCCPPNRSDGCTPERGVTIERLGPLFGSGPVTQPSTPGKRTRSPVTDPVSAEDVFRNNCVACHDTTGRGNPEIRKTVRELPNFASPTWQKSRTDADLVHSILEGKGEHMLPMKDKLGAVPVEELVALVRAFQRGKQTISSEAPKSSSPLPQSLADVADPMPPGEPLRLSPSGRTLSTRSNEAAARLRAGADVFRHHCAVCHSTDGTGNIARGSMRAIPNFTSSTWQQHHSDAEMLASILDGKGTSMPAHRGQITENETRDVVAYVRSFGPELERTRSQAAEREFGKSFRQLQDEWNELLEARKQGK